MPCTTPERRTSRRALLTLLTALVAGLLTALPSAPAQARIYDAVRVDDPVGDLQGARFPDMIRVKFHHDVTDGKEFFIAKMQLRRDVSWQDFRTAGFRANRYSITTRSLEPRPRVHIRRPRGSEYVCHRCKVWIYKDRKRIVFRLPWPRIGSPENVRVSPSYVSAGYVMDTADAPYRVLY
jgi:hypothetical protein